MEQNNKKKTLILSILGVLLLIGSVIGITYSFFNYTRTGTENTIKTGNISFNSTQDNTISLTNVFPTSSTNLNSTNSDTVTINIAGDTTYSEGIEYKVTLDQVNNTINNKEVPISIKATATNLGTEDSNYYTNRENKEKIYLLNEEGEAYNGKYIAVGYIPAGSTGVNGSIDITAFIDTNKVAISDTYDGNESDLMGTTDDWVKGREVFTTTEWNSFNSGNPLSFKVKVEANEGIWVEKEKFLTMKNLSNITEWTNIRANITSIEFHKDGIAPANPVTSFDVTDSTSDPTKGNITLYTVDDGLDNNTYKAIVVGNDTIYAPENSSMLFGGMSNLIEFYSRNFRVDNTKSLHNLFMLCEKLSLIYGINNWNVENVENMTQMFLGCVNIELIDLGNWNTLSLSQMSGMFAMVNSAGKARFDSKLKMIVLSDMFDTSKVKKMNMLLANNTKIEDYSFLQYFITDRVEDMTQMFGNNLGLTNLNYLSNWNISSVTKMTQMFIGCSNISDASAINDWDINASAAFTQMFKGSLSHPEFSKFPNGTWDENGTFTPNV